MSTNMSTNNILCIPRIKSNITEKYIRNVFKDIKLGEIERIDIVPKIMENGEKMNRAFIHFNKWYSNTNAIRAREILLNGEEIKVIYDEPWFWKISAYRKQIQFNNTEKEKNIPKLSLKKPQLRRDIAQNRKINGEPKTPGTPKTPPTPIRELMDYVLDDNEESENIQEEELI